MQFKKVLLINPPYKGARVRAVFSAGLGYVAESLITAGFEYDVLDMSLGYGWNALQNKIKTFNPDLIGISMMSYRYKDTYKLIEKIKSNYGKIKITAGGPYISLMREKVLSDCYAIDYGVVSEGEETLVDLCQGKPADSIKGLIFRIDGNIKYNGDRPFIENLDEISFPKYEKFELNRIINKNINALPIVSSRGCPFDCIYCPVSCSIGKKFRARSPVNIIKELTYWYEKGYTRFSFADDNFTLLKDRVYKFCELLKNSKLKDIKLSCDNGIRADKVDKELLKFMREAGFYRIAFGVEGGNDKVLKNLHKSEDIETIKTRISEACDLGYEVDLFFLVGSPYETFDDLKDSFKIALDYPIGTAYFYNIIPFPNTKLFEWIEKNGRFLKKPEDYLDEYPILDNQPVFETIEMSEKERKKALKEAFKITGRTMYKSWSKRLVNLGIFGKILAFVYTTQLMQNVILRNTALRKLAYKLALLKVSFS